MAASAKALPLKPDKKIVETYFTREAEGRKIRLIEREIKEIDTVLDLGCCNGLYGEVLKNQCQKLIGVDVDASFVAYCEASGFYDQVSQMQVPPIDLKDDSVNVVFASEIIEHMPDLPSVMSEIERITTDKVILTMPNPLYPDFYTDPTHILEYTVRSLKKDLNKSDKFKYKVFGLGFENIPAPNFIKKFNQWCLKPFPMLCPTIGIIGVRR